MVHSRKLVSFSGSCPINCKHCYTHELNHGKYKSDMDEIPEIVEALNDGKPFDIIYVSRSRENFIDEVAGVNLVTKLFEKYHKHIFVITRKILSDQCIDNIVSLNRKMKQEGLFFGMAVSVPARGSYSITESPECIESPNARCELIKKLHNNGITTILMARPVFPNRVIPTHEIISLIEEYSPYIDAVVSSGLAVNDAILKQLNMVRADFQFLDGNNAEFLIGSEARDIQYIDVKDELKEIEHCCQLYSIPFSTHSMHAINMLIDRALS